MDDPNIIMQDYIRLEEEKAHRRGKVFNWETPKYGKIWDDKDFHDLRSVETEFPAIVFDDAFTSEITHSCEPTVSPLNDNKINFRISFDESNDEDYTVIYDKHSFSYKIIYVNDLKTDSEYDNDKVNLPLLPSPEPTTKGGDIGIEMVVQNAMMVRDEHRDILGHESRGLAGPSGSVDGLAGWMLRTTRDLDDQAGSMIDPFLGREADYPPFGYTGPLPPGYDYRYGTAPDGSN
ncbi:hypothetical protein Tco_1563169 [Tanacetum coccineum]